MARVLGYAKERGYTIYTSTLVEAWRLSISGLSDSILTAIELHPDIPELSPDEDLSHDPLAQFGIVEAQRHRERGVSLPMFLGLMKYYRQSYLDLLAAQDWTASDLDRYALFINRVFDRIEIGFCTEWSGGTGELAIHELQVKNRLMTNEKNKYLTIFESIPIPVVILNANNEIDNMNLAAAKFFHAQATAGGQYYSVPEEEPSGGKANPEGHGPDDGHHYINDADLFSLFPWLRQEVSRHLREGMETSCVEKEIEVFGQKKFLGVRVTKNLDISEKFEGFIIIFEDLTPLKNEQKVLIERERLQAVVQTVGMVYHELNQPLQVISGLSELMLMDQEVSPEQKSNLQQISRAAQKLSSIIKKLDKINSYKSKPYVGQSLILDLEESAKEKY